jgi:hypothetical protein
VISDKNTAVPAEVPPSGLKVAAGAFDLPRRLSIEIVPDATPANVRTADSLSEIEAVADRPSSVLTCDMDMVVVGSAMLLLQHLDFVA